MSALDALSPLPTPAWHRDHLSASFVEQLLRCPEQTRRVRVLGERERPAQALVWGSADHAAHAVNLTQKIETLEDLPTSDVQDAFCDALAQEIDAAGGEDEIEWEDKPAEVKDRGTALVALYHEKVSPSLHPLAVEERFEALLPGVPVPVVGIVDVREAAQIIDRKTQNKASKAPKPQWTTQSLLYRAVTGKPLEWHLVVKSGKIVLPENEPALREPYTPDVAERAAMRFTRAAQLFEFLMETYGPDEPWPDAMSHPWACGFCGFRDTCPWWAK